MWKLVGQHVLFWNVTLIIRGLDCRLIGRLSLSQFNSMRFGKFIYLKILKLSWQDVFFYRRRCDRCCASALLWTKTRPHVMNPPHYGGVHLVKVSSFLIFKLEDITHTGRKCVCAVAGHQLWRPKNITPQQNCCHGSVCVWRLLQGGSCGWFHPKASQQDRTHFEMIHDVWSDCCSGWWSIIQSAEPFIISLINTQRHTRWICINPIHGCVVLVQHTQTAHRLLISSHINTVFTAAHTHAITLIYHMSLELQSGASRCSVWTWNTQVSGQVKTQIWQQLNEVSV